MWIEGGFELICSPRLIDELTRALNYRKLRRHIHTDEAGALVALLRRAATMIDDPLSAPTVSSSDPDDDYLVALAESSRSALVSGDGDLLSLSGQIPVYSPHEFLAILEQEP